MISFKRLFGASLLLAGFSCSLEAAMLRPLPLRLCAQNAIDTCLSFKREQLLANKKNYQGEERFRQMDKFGNTLMHYIAMLKPTCSLGQQLTPDELQVVNGVPHLTGRQELFAYLCAQKVNINAQNKQGQTPLHLAVINNNQEAFTMFLAARANPNVRDNHGLPPLFYAIKQNHAFCAQKLFNESSKESIQIALRACPLLDHHVISLQRLIGQSVQKPWAVMFDGTQRTLLHYAAEVPGAINAVIHLLINGANPCVLNRADETPFMVAVEGNNEPAARVMFSRMPPIDSMTFNRLPLLHYFVDQKNIPAITMLLKLGASPQQKDYLGKSAFFHAIETNKEEIVRFFDYKQLLVNDTYKGQPICVYLVQNPKGRSMALLTKLGFFDPAARLIQNPQELRALIQCKAWSALRTVLDIDKDSQLEGMDLLRCAISTKDKEKIGPLIKAGALDLIRMPEGKTLLHDLAAHDDDELHDLLDYVDVDLCTLVDDNGQTVLHVATFFGHREQASYLLEGCPGLINISDHHGKTPLHVAVEQKKKDLVGIFARGYQADACAKDDKSNSPIMLAALQKDFDTMVVLCETVAHKEMLAHEIKLAVDRLYDSTFGKHKTSDACTHETAQFLQRLAEWKEGKNKKSA